MSTPEFDAGFHVNGDCPVQGFGTVLGRELYFCARHENWTFDVADSNGNLTSDGRSGPDGFFREGEYQNAGHMPLRFGVKITMQSLREFTGVF